MNNSGQTIEQEFINEVYTAAETGKMAISELRDDKIAGVMQDILNMHYKGYEELSRRALKMMADKGGIPKGVSRSMEMMQRSMLKMSSMTDRSDSHYAKLLYEGNNKGVVNIRGKLNECESMMSDDVVRFGKESLDLMDSFNDELARQL